MLSRPGHLGDVHPGRSGRAFRRRLSGRREPAKHHPPCDGRARGVTGCVPVHYSASSASRRYGGFSGCSAFFSSSAYRTSGSDASGAEAAAWRFRRRIVEHPVHAAFAVQDPVLRHALAVHERLDILDPLDAAQELGLHLFEDRGDGLVERVEDRFELDLEELLEVLLELDQPLARAGGDLLELLDAVAGGASRTARSARPAAGARPPRGPRTSPSPPSRARPPRSSSCSGGGCC